MATNGFGSIYPKSYWGVTDAENGFGNVYKDLAQQTILLNFELINAGGQITINQYLTNNAIDGYSKSLNVNYKISFYDINGNLINTKPMNFRFRDLVDNHNNTLVNSIILEPYNINIQSCKMEINYLEEDTIIISNPFQFNGQNYLVKLTPAI